MNFTFQIIAKIIAKKIKEFCKALKNSHLDKEIKICNSIRNIYPNFFEKIELC